MSNDDQTPTIDATDTPASPSRRTVVRATAVTGVGVAGLGLAACGGSSGSGSSGSASGGGSAGGTTVAKADVPVGGGKILSDAKVVVTQPTAGSFKAFSAVCTHAGCTVGSIESGAIVCPCHQSHFSIKDGSVESGPAPAPLPAKTVTAEGSSLKIS
ncbi:Rieske (2Fe-2S) protein [Allobranchiibius sp. CTAmp26]|uniref:Rieske (2Fe-2S) protein n=1 Tax=Allobranchiibius sp. CTAmp26 TaxID=2815214 RepID=UPI001AA1028F|nr:Rieske (2Fe-2S) protein [Allobranchiibius sp. CTAmp26]MBO1754100.1 Rieske (2Fe-2S) protein [Allobranchiibius sp. CTAmp26]